MPCSTARLTSCHPPRRRSTRRTTCRRAMLTWQRRLSGRCSSGGCSPTWWCGTASWPARWAQRRGTQRGQRCAAGGTLLGCARVQASAAAHARTACAASTAPSAAAPEHVPLAPATLPRWARFHTACAGALGASHITPPSESNPPFPLPWAPPPTPPPPPGQGGAAGPGLCHLPRHAGRGRAPHPPHLLHARVGLRPRAPAAAGRRRRGAPHAAGGGWGVGGREGQAGLWGGVG